MIKSSKVLKFIGMLISVSFTVLMLQTFAVELHERILYFFTGLMPEACKIILLLAAIKFLKKSKKLFVLLVALFVPFASVSLAASISFAMYTVEKQMFVIEQTEDTSYSHNYAIVYQQAADIRDAIARLEAERANELNRANAEIDSLPAEYFVTRRRELAEDRNVLIDSYDRRISDLRTELNEKNELLMSLSTGMAQSQNMTETRRLSDNAVAGLFTTISDLSGASIENLVLWYAMALGVIIDLSGAVLALVEGFTVPEIVTKKKPAKKKSPLLGTENVTDETLGLTQMELELPVDEPVGTMEPLETNGPSEEDTSPTHIFNEKIKPEAKEQKQTKYDHFVSFVESNGIDVLGLTYSKLMKIAPSLKMSKTTYHRCVKAYMDEPKPTL
jgi:hypothetical protein